jgi:hypothetical protein
MPEFALNHEETRKGFKPSKIRVLFVGESPPTNGGFFYIDSLMTKYMADVFSEVFGKKFTNDFLKFFKAKNCYLDDISIAPVDNKTPKERERIINECIDAFAKRLDKFKPKLVIAVLMRIEKPTKKAVCLAGLRVPVYAVPFPGNGHQNRFRSELTKILREHRKVLK